MTNSPSISTIVPCFNQAGFLREVVATLRNQTSQDWEAILVNDGSTDETASVARSLIDGDSRFTLINQSNRGLSGARNSGILAAKGEFLHFLDADDLLHPDAFAWLCGAACKHPDTLILMRHAEFTTDPAIDRRELPAPPEVAAFFPSLITRNLGPVHTWLVPRKSVVEAGGFDENLCACEDWDLWLRLALQGASLKQIPNVGAYYRRYPGSMSSNPTRMFLGWLPTHLRNWKALQTPQPFEHHFPHVSRMDLLNLETVQIRQAVFKVTWQLYCRGQFRLATRLWRNCSTRFRTSVSTQLQETREALSWIPSMTLGRSLRLSSHDQEQLLAREAELEQWFLTGPTPRLISTPSTREAE